MPDEAYEEGTRGRILTAAGLIFSEKGFQAATVREICAAADVNVASINYHFGDKNRLYIEAVKHAHRCKAEQVPLPEWPAETPPEVRLRGFIETTVGRLLGVEHQPWEMRLLMREVLRPTEAGKELVEDFFRPHIEQLLSILDQLVPERTALHKKQQLAFSIIGQCLFYRVNDAIIRMMIPEEELGKHFQPSALAGHIYDVTVAALRADLTFPIDSPLGSVRSSLHSTGAATK